MYGVTMNLTLEFIVHIITLPVGELKVRKETSILNATFKKFQKTNDEEKWLVKNGDFFNLEQLKTIWKDFFSYIHEYFILDRRSKRVHKFHFVFVNHFQYKDKMSFPFYLKFSLLESLQTHRKKEYRLVLHEGLILLIENYCKSNAMKPSHLT